MFQLILKWSNISSKGITNIRKYLKMQKVFKESVEQFQFNSSFSNVNSVSFRSAAMKHKEINCLQFVECIYLQMN